MSRPAQLRPPGPLCDRRHRRDRLQPRLRPQRPDAGHASGVGSDRRRRPATRRHRRHRPLRHGHRLPPRPGRVRRPAQRHVLGRGRPRRRGGGGDGRPGRRRDPVRAGDHGAGVPRAERPLRSSVRLVLGEQPGRGRRRQLRRAVHAVRAPHAGPGVRDVRPAPHDRVRHHARAARPDPDHVPQAGQREPPRADARSPDDHRRLPLVADDLDAAADVRLLPRDRRSVCGRRHDGRASRRPRPTAGAHPRRRPGDHSRALSRA